MIEKKIWNIGFISTRLQGTDGVSLETEKWVHVLEKRLGHNCFYFSGQSDWTPSKSMVVEEAFFQNEKILNLQKKIFKQQHDQGKFKMKRTQETTLEIEKLTHFLKKKLYEFQKQFNLDMIIPENALTIPMNIPLGLAISQFIAETSIPCIAHHHDFFWERERFLISSINDYLEMSFPPNLPSMRHVVINSLGKKQLSFRKGISSKIIPNVFDFDIKPEDLQTKETKEFCKTIEKDLGINKEKDIIILQPTRIVARKGIEHAIEMISHINSSKDSPKGKTAKLFISHFGGDEGGEYEKRIQFYSKKMDVEIIKKPHKIGAQRKVDKNGDKVYTLWDFYPHSDFVTYPSLIEGFGNALLEAIYFKKPILVNRYPVFITDIETKGFKFITMDGFLTEKVIKNTLETLNLSKEKLQEMVEENFKIAKKYFSYDILERKLSQLLKYFEKEFEI